MFFVLATAGALELGARALQALEPERWPPHSVILESLEAGSPVDPGAAGGAPQAASNVLHPYVGYVRNPAPFSERRVNALIVEDEVNALGYFGKSALAPRSDGTLRIAVTGGSVAEELFIYGRAALRDELRASGAFGGREIEIVSVALAGYKQPQQLLALSYLLVLGAPIDVVVNLDGFNEAVLPFTDNLRMQLSPVYPFRWNSVATDGLDPEISRVVTAIAQTRAQLESRRHWLRSSALRHSAFAGLAWQALDRRGERHATALEGELRERLGADDALPAALRGPDLAIDDPQSLFETSVEIWSRASSQLSALSEARGITYHHFLQPNQYVAGSKVLTDAERKVAILASDSSTRFGAETGYPLLIAEGRRLRAAGVPFHDLTDLFAEIAEPIYRDGCCHYLLAGYELVARRIARTIAAAAD